MGAKVWCEMRVIRELKKLRRQLQGKRLIKTELCVKLSLLRLFHVDHVVQNGFRVKAKKERFTAACSRCRQNLKYANFTSSFGRLRQNIAPKSVLHVQHDYFSSFNQSNHWFVALALTLPSSDLKLPIRQRIRRMVFQISTNERWRDVYLYFSWNWFALLWSVFEGNKQGYHSCTILLPAIGKYREYHRFWVMSADRFFGELFFTITMKRKAVK